MYVCKITSRRENMRQKTCKNNSAQLKKIKWLQSGTTYIWCSNNMVLIIKDSCSLYSSILNFLLLEGGASENVGQTNVVGQTLICLIFWLFGQLQFFGQLIHIQNCQGLELMVSILCVRLWYHITYTYLINLRATAPHSVTL